MNEHYRRAFYVCRLVSALLVARIHLHYQHHPEHQDNVKQLPISLLKFSRERRATNCDNFVAYSVGNLPLAIVGQARGNDLPRF